MAYDYSNADSRARRGHKDDSYNGPTGSKRSSVYVEPYVSEVGDDERPYEVHEVPQHHLNTSHFTGEVPLNPSQTESTEQVVSINNVSPDLLAEITEKIKKEVVEHLKQATTASSATHEQHEPAQTQRSESPDKLPSTPSPPLVSQKVYTPPSSSQSSRRRASNSSSSPHPFERLKSSSRSPDKSGTRSMNRGRKEGVGARASRPNVGRTFSTAELSAIDQKWGCLVDHDGKPTLRLGKVLKGLANHIIEDFEPKKSIVITPAKMAEYYGRYGLENEVYPFASIFRAGSPERISRLYQELGCFHHLISVDPRKPPAIPGLTPVGFAEWTTHWILAYPDAEAARLEEVVLSLPIDADGETIDGKPERLPKQISRHLLPSTEDKYLRRTLHESMSSCLEELDSSRRPRASTTNNPPFTHQASLSQPQPPQTRTKSTETPAHKPVERERMPYANTAATGDTASTDDPLPVQIERERQPYTAMPGHSKVYTDGRATTTVHNSSSGTTRRERANSTTRSEDLPPREKEERRHARSSSTTTSSYVPALRPGGARRPPSPKITSFSQSTPLDIDLDSERRDRETERDHYESYNSGYSRNSVPFLVPEPYAVSGGFHSPTVIVDARERESQRGRDQARDRENYRDRDMRGFERQRDRSDVRESRDTPQKWEDDARRYPANTRPRRGTLAELPPSRFQNDISSPREAERWDRLRDEIGAEDYYRGRGGADHLRH